MLKAEKKAEYKKYPANIKKNICEWIKSLFKDWANKMKRLQDLSPGTCMKKMCFLHLWKLRIILLIY